MGSHVYSTMEGLETDQPYGQSVNHAHMMEPSHPLPNSGLQAPGAVLVDYTPLSHMVIRRS